MNDIIWVTDRGSNIKKVLEEYEVVFCACHRVNNILEKVFFQTEKKKKKKKTEQSNDEVLEDEEEMISDSEESSEDNEDDVMNLEQRQRTNQRQQQNQQQNIKRTSTVVRVIVNHLTILRSEIPPEAKRVIDLIVTSKKLVTYVKLVCIS
jgi:hypothetical protein